MTKPTKPKAPRRRRRETQEAPRGIGGVPTFPARGPIATLRVLGCGHEIKLDVDRTELYIGRDGPPTSDVQLPFPSVSRVHALMTRRHGGLDVTDQGAKHGSGPAIHHTRDDYVLVKRFFVHPGDRFRLGSVCLLALDEETSRLTEPLTAYCGHGAHADVDRALAAMARRMMLIVYGSSGSAPLSLAHTLHAHSIHKDYPFTALDALPSSASAIDDLCARAGCGTVFLDMTRPIAVPGRFARNLLSPHFHLWTVIAARRLADVFEGLGAAWHTRSIDSDYSAIGFPREGWHRGIKHVSYSKLGGESAQPPEHRADSPNHTTTNRTQGERFATKEAEDERA